MESKMSIVEKLKIESMKLRKARDPLAPKIVFALSEIEKVGKNKGNRETTEDEAMKALQKIISVIDQNIELLSPNSPVVYDLERERSILDSVLPQLVSAEVIRTFLELSFDETSKNKGLMMKSVKEQYAPYVDMKLVSGIINELYGV
jgi:uncharacterized protein